ncbi:MAG: enoyl-CoA hydratase-related protein [Actinomycetota bacterium]|nr:enoyl-CoA hydratase-related protein [Actinomycetota bacterium]
MDSSIDMDIDGKVAYVTINRPEAMNTLNEAALEALDKVFYDIAAQDEICVAVVTGSGQRAFSAGADLKELESKSSAEMMALSERAQSLYQRIEAIGKPVIAAVNGLALGAGFELSLAATMRVMADTARVGFPEITLGAIPGYGGTQRLVHSIGQGLAIEMLLTGELMSAARAYELGLANQIVPADELMAKTSELAQRLAGFSPLAMRILLQVFYLGNDSPLSTGLALERMGVATLFASEDLREGIAAFREKRSPLFHGR